MKRNLFAGRRRSGGLKLDVFTEDEIQDIHLSTLELLERTGVWVELDEALDIYSDGGCVVDRESRIVRIPPHVVEDADRQRAARAWCSTAATRESTPASSRAARASATPARASRSSIRGPASCAVDEAGPRGHRPAGRRAPRGRRVRHGRRLQRPAAAVVQPAQPRGRHRQPDQADLGRRRGRRRRPPHRGHLAAVQGGKDAVRARPTTVFGTCPVSPLSSSKTSARSSSSPRASACRAACSAWPWPAARSRCARRHAGHPQRRGARRHRPRPAHRARQQAALRLLVDRHGPALVAASVRTPESRSSAPARRCSQAVSPAEPHRRCERDRKTSDVETGHEKTLTALTAALAGTN